MSPVNGDFDSPFKSIHAQSPVFKDAVVPVPYEVVAEGLVFRLAGRPRASVHGFDGPIVPDDVDYGRLRHLRAHVVFIAEPTIDKLVERFLTECPVLPRCLADHVATVKVSGARVGERLRLVGSRFDTHRVGERIKYVASPLPDISFNDCCYSNRLLKESRGDSSPPTRGGVSSPKIMKQETGRAMRYTTNLRTIKPLAHGHGLLVTTSATKDVWTL